MRSPGRSLEKGLGTTSETLTVAELHDAVEDPKPLTYQISL